jgi:hypothetical protein
VEGRTEEIVLKRLHEILGFRGPGSGMAITNMRGVDQAHRHEMLFRSATRGGRPYCSDRRPRGTLSRVLERLRAEGLFREQGDVLLWERDGRSLDFEEANFTDSELLRAIRSAARKRDRHVQLALTVRELREERARQTPLKRPMPALTKLALTMAEDRGVRDSKPELAAVLAETLVREIREAGDLHAAGERRPPLEPAMALAGARAIRSGEINVPARQDESRHEGVAGSSPAVGSVGRRANGKDRVSSPVARPCTRSSSRRGTPPRSCAAARPPT